MPDRVTIDFDMVRDYIQRLSDRNPGHIAAVNDRFNVEASLDEMAESVWGLIAQGFFAVRLGEDGEISFIYETARSTDGMHRTWPMKDVL